MSGLLLFFRNAHGLALHQPLGLPYHLPTQQADRAQRQQKDQLANTRYPVRVARRQVKVAHLQLARHSYERVLAQHD